MVTGKWYQILIWTIPQQERAEPEMGKIWNNIQFDITRVHKRALNLNFSFYMLFIYCIFIYVNLNSFLHQATSKQKPLKILT